MKKTRFSMCLILVTIFASYNLAIACTDNAECPPGYYCEKAPGDCSGEGVCTPIPEICIDVWAPVCGCDGQTYSNACYAAMAGVNVAYNGECTPGACGDNSDCIFPDYCAKDVGDCDGIGTCTTPPAACPDVWDPVCGCDGQTYDNACYAAMARVNVEYAGPCTSSPCSTNGDCPPTHYCAKDVGDCDGPGTCTERPAACPDVWDPVCGCDGQTYGNACYAAMAGVNLKYYGECAACVNRPAADLSGDCWVDIIDLAMFAAEWLDCGLDKTQYCFN